jgi:SAM-dependent methyltransferase
MHEGFMPGATEVNQKYFREAYRTGLHGWETEEPSPWALAFLRKVKKRGAVPKLLDVGCGEGRHCIAARRLGFEVTGIDFQPLALARARRFAAMRRLSGISFRRADILAQPFRRSSFDVVLDWGCLHHQRKTDWPSYLHELLRVLKPEGFYILSVFSPEFRYFRGSERSWHVAYGAYRRCFTESEIRTLFCRHFEILQIVEDRAEGRGFFHALMRRRGDDRCYPC